MSISGIEDNGMRGAGSLRGGSGASGNAFMLQHRQTDGSCPYQRE
jgi:hypothetical protein